MKRREHRYGGLGQDMGNVPGWRIPNISSYLPIPLVVNVLEIFDSKNSDEKNQN
jgi:hypothetical protein